MHKDLRVSLVIPVRNEAATISDLLASIYGQTLRACEIVFVDGGSMDDTVQILREAARENSFLRLLEAQDATPGRGRNVGIEAASNDWVALTDAGVRLEPTWLERLVVEVERDEREPAGAGPERPGGHPPGQHLGAGRAGARAAGSDRRDGRPDVVAVPDDEGVSRVS